MPAGPRTSHIRPLERGDLPAVAAVYEAVARSGSSPPPSGLAAHFERTLLDHPWADTEIPSLVYVDEGEIVGFLGSHVRRMRFDGRSARLACGGQLVTHPAIRNRAAGAFLIQAFLSGPQDLTITDTASAAVRRMWEGLGGATAFTSCVGWIRVLKPWAFASDYRRRSREARPEPANPTPLLRPLDAVASRLGSRWLGVRTPDTQRSELTAADVVGGVRELAASLRLLPDYDIAFVDWIFRETAAVKTRGRLVRLRVSECDGRLLGWFVYYFRPGGISNVLQIAAHAARGGTGGRRALRRRAHPRGRGPRGTARARPLRRPGKAPVSTPLRWLPRSRPLAQPRDRRRDPCRRRSPHPPGGRVVDGSSPRALRVTEEPRPKTAFFVPRPSELDEAVAEALSWVHEAGNPYFDRLFGGRDEARAVLARWMRRPTSEIFIGRARLLGEGERPIGGFIALGGRELAASRKADAIAAVAEARNAGRPSFLSRLQEAGRVFLPVEGDDFYLSKMGVQPMFRRLGHGRGLLEEYLAFGSGRGFRRFRLDVWKGNRIAFELYRSAGFRELSEGAAENPSNLQYAAMVLDLRDFPGEAFYGSVCLAES